MVYTKYLRRCRRCGNNYWALISSSYICNKCDRRQGWKGDRRTRDKL